MSTVNLSLPTEQVRFIDDLVVRFQFANRSEFVRSLLRFIRHEPRVLERVANFPFVVPQTRSVNAIMSDFKKTGSYSPSFLKDLEDGLKASTFFKH